MDTIRSMAYYPWQAWPIYIILFVITWTGPITFDERPILLLFTRTWRDWKLAGIITCVLVPCLIVGVWLLALGIVEGYQLWQFLDLSCGGC